ncbi:MAG TPA: pyrroline-5-carboxylate reductase, partial [Bdellovibrionota bacterium]|nr:pyrroline-5-carboxylate reductase [Bdellovibrionota bacterium]
MKVGVIGLGKMGESLIRGLRRESGGKNFKITGTTRSKDSATEAAKRLEIPVHNDNEKCVKDSEVILLCVKPYQAEKVVREVAGALKKDHLLISILTGITTEQLGLWSGGKTPIVRSMPNMPAQIGMGMTVMAAGKSAQASHVEAAEKIFATVGRTAVVEEHLMDGVTGLNGSGPAYIYLVIEALAEAGVKVGLPRKTAMLIAAQNLLGASHMVLERGVHPAELKDEVTTPAGCTVDGLMALEEGR